MKTLGRAALFLTLFAGILVSCDLSSALGGSKAINPLGSYVISATNNTQITTDIPATIQAGVIYLILPYTLENTALTPTPGLPSSDYAINPSGSYVMQNGMSITVTRNSTGQTYTYILQVAITEATLPAPVETPVLSSFVLKTSNNTSLSSDITALISGTTISVTLPYTATQTPLTPTVTFAGSNYTISPSGSFVFHNGATITITDTSSNQLYAYTLAVAIDPATLPTQSLIASFVLQPSNNPALSGTVSAIISGTTVSIVLPYTASLAALTPTVTFISSAYTMSPSGAFVFTNGATLYIINNQTSQTYTYTLKVSLDPATIPAQSLITSYTLKAANNASLSSDVSALISGSTIAVTLPYTIVHNSTPLVPTLTFVSSDYTATPASGSSYVLTNGMTLTVTQLSTGQTYTYTLKVSVDPATVLRINVDRSIFFAIAPERSAILPT